MKEKILGMGAEAVLIHKNNRLIKKRIEKSYRIKEIDIKLRKLRTRSEGKIMDRLYGRIFVPKIFRVSEHDNEIEMEFISGKKLSENLDKFYLSRQKEICFKIGEKVGKLHSLDIIHGDLTTSNMILHGKEEIYFVDFGLSFGSRRNEDRAVDLHLLKQALEAKHYKNWRILFQEVLKGYKKFEFSSEILKQLEKVEKRGRYKNH